MDHRERMQRWRLAMGPGSEQACGNCLSGEDDARDRALGFIYDREYGKGRNVRGGSGASADRRGGLGDSELTVPEWINDVHALFPKKTIERIEKDALERYQLDEMVTNPEVIARAQPNMTLLKAVLRTKHLMNEKVLVMARGLVRKVVEQLMEKLARDVRNPFLGAVDRRRRSFMKIAKNFDIESTIRRNLKHYDAQHKRLTIETPYFYSRVRRQTDRWQIIILVDQSGSMAESVIHSSICAAIFHGIKALKTHVVAFDTHVVDMTDDCHDPVAMLMKVQLGGGTDIGGALQYGASLVTNPRRTIVVLITDFFEGGPIHALYATARSLIESGVTLLGLAALDSQANPTYDHEVARRMVALGAHVAAMTPGELAEWVAQKVR
jgi:Mg-chelatase subunit ChlD